MDLAVEFRLHEFSLVTKISVTLRYEKQRGNVKRNIKVYMCKFNFKYYPACLFRNVMVLTDIRARFVILVRKKRRQALSRERR